MSKLALIDMDGTLFDHNRTLKADLLEVTPRIYHDTILKCLDFHELEGMPWMKNLMDLIRTSPGWWRKLPRFQLGWDVYQLLEDVGFCCKILTKGPKSKPIAWMEKVQCIQDHFGSDLPIDIVGKDKGGTYGRVLVDDYPSYIEKWVKHRPRGLVIMPAHPYNLDFQHDNVIRYDGDNIEQVHVALKAAYIRKSSEHWLDLV